MSKHPPTKDRAQTPARSPNANGNILAMSARRNRLSISADTSLTAASVDRVVKGRSATDGSSLDESAASPFRARVTAVDEGVGRRGRGGLRALERWRTKGRLTGIDDDWKRDGEPQICEPQESGEDQKCYPSWAAADHDPAALRRRGTERVSRARSREEQDRFARSGAAWKSSSSPSVPSGMYS
jgi:hypothetical protein